MEPAGVANQSKPPVVSAEKRTKGDQFPSIPFFVLSEANTLQLDVKFETVTGYTYSGKLVGADEHMNVSLETATVVKLDANGDNLTEPQFHSQVFVRGNQIMMFMLPSELEQEYVKQTKAMRLRMRKLGALGKGKGGKKKGRAKTSGPRAVKK